MILMMMCVTGSFFAFMLAWVVGMHGTKCTRFFLPKSKAILSSASKATKALQGNARKIQKTLFSKASNIAKTLQGTKWTCPLRLGIMMRHLLLATQGVILMALLFLLVWYVSLPVCPFFLPSSPVALSQNLDLAHCMKEVKVVVIFCTL